MSRETLPTFGNMIEHSAPQIRGVRRALEMAQSVCTNEGQRKIIALNYAFLVSKGRLSEADYLALLKHCVDENDFTELGMTFRAHQLAQVTRESETPGLPQSGDDFYPGRQNLQNEMALVKASAHTIKGKKKKSGKNPIANCGTPSLRHQPEWFLTMEQEKMTLDEVFALVDKPSDQPSAGGADVVNITTGARRRVYDVA